MSSNKLKIFDRKVVHICYHPEGLDVFCFKTKNGTGTLCRLSTNVELNITERTDAIPHEVNAENDTPTEEESIVEAEEVQELLSSCADNMYERLVMQIEKVIGMKLELDSHEARFFSDLKQTLHTLMKQALPLNTTLYNLNTLKRIYIQLCDYLIDTLTYVNTKTINPLRINPGNKAKDY